MGSSTVNISFNDDLLKQIDRVADEESRSRSELIREAARSYIDRKQRWDNIFNAASKAAHSSDLKPGDIENEIKAFRSGKRNTR